MINTEKRSRLYLLTAVFSQIYIPSTQFGQTVFFLFIKFAKQKIVENQLLAAVRDIYVSICIRYTRPDFSSSGGLSIKLGAKDGFDVAVCVSKFSVVFLSLTFPFRSFKFVLNFVCKTNTKHKYAKHNVISTTSVEILLILFFLVSRFNGPLCISNI